MHFICHFRKYNLQTWGKQEVKSIIVLIIFAKKNPRYSSASVLMSEGKISPKDFSYLTTVLTSEEHLSYACLPESKHTNVTLNYLWTPAALASKLYQIMLDNALSLWRITAYLCFYVSLSCENLLSHNRCQSQIQSLSPEETAKLKE